MKWSPLASTLLCVTPIVCHSAVYLTTEQAQKLIFPNATLQKIAVHLTPEQQKALDKTSNVSYAIETDQIYKSSDGGWFMIDQALGKHEMITYAIGINADGSIKQVEILQYNESYGEQVRGASWRQQFVGKTATSPLTLNKDIHNISGATLSSKHLTDSIRRVLQFHALVLKSLTS
ncbi:MAG: FMN-binding protein [Gammaproteobacteria bacterium]|nr:FMN-binding protein [Gammaproteobacteria bacterium]